jgi:hypothetical protein
MAELGGGGIGWLKPKGDMELVNANVGFTGEQMEVPSSPPPPPPLCLCVVCL